MKALILAVLLTATAAQATPCDGARKDFARAKQFGAYDFKCQDRYDGTATSSWYMPPEGFKAFSEAERERKRRKKK